MWTVYPVKYLIGNRDNNVMSTSVNLLSSVADSASVGSNIHVLGSSLNLTFPNFDNYIINPLMQHWRVFDLSSMMFIKKIISVGQIKICNPFACSLSYIH